MNNVNFKLPIKYIPNISIDNHLINDLELLPNDFNLDLALLIASRKAGYSIKLFDLIFYNRTFNRSKGGGSLKGKFKLSFSTLNYLFTNVSFLKK